MLDVISQPKRLPQLPEPTALVEANAVADGNEKKAFKKIAGRRSSARKAGRTRARD